MDPDGINRGSAINVRTNKAITKAIAKTLIFSAIDDLSDLLGDGSLDDDLGDGSSMTTGTKDDTLQPVEYKLTLCPIPGTILERFILLYFILGSHYGVYIDTRCFDASSGQS